MKKETFDGRAAVPQSYQPCGRSWQIARKKKNHTHSPSQNPCRNNVFRNDIMSHCRIAHTRIIAIVWVAIVA